MHCPIMRVTCMSCAHTCQRLKGDIVPQHIGDIVTKLNQELGNAKVEAYLQTDSDFPDEWRLRILDANDHEVCRHLSPHKVEWHTLRILLDARLKHGQHMFAQGKDSAVNTICNEFHKMVKWVKPE